MASDVLWCRWPVFLSLFLERTVLSSLHVLGLIFMNCPHTCGFIPGLSILSSSPCACVCASSSLLWLLQLHDVVWSQRGRCLQVHSSFSESFGLFRVLSCCRILLGIFIFLWKIPLDIMSTVHLLMALVGMDILITHFSSARAWTIFLFICIFFGFFISAF